MKKVKLVAATILLASLVLFLLQNLNTTEVKFLVWKTELSVAIPILAAFFIGGVGARPMIRFLNGQRRERKRDRKAAKRAAKAAKNAAHAATTEVIPETPDAAAVEPTSGKLDGAHPQTASSESVKPKPAT